MEALKALVENQGMSARAIRQGFSVTRATSHAAATPRYNCQNDSIEIRIAAMPLEDALNALSDATHCPISRSFAVNGLRSRSVSGSFTPSQALQAMLLGTGLQGQVIRQGLTVVPGPR
ncbi:hypothetical protein DDF62_22455 [Caulobacter radicis]|nr:hypothetical protein DDF62_22455 [Caulobacter radicis]